jgi:predicted permease
MNEVGLRLIPLLALVVLGWITGRYLKLTRDAIAPTLIYLLAPLTIFKGVLDAQLNAELLMLPLLYFGLCSAICALAWGLGGRIFPSPSRNILAYTAGNANSGYFGLPAAVALLGAESFPRAVMISFGFTLFEVTVGFYVTARGHHTVKEALVKLLKLPTIYVVALGAILNLAGFRAEGPSFEFLNWIKGTYSTLGMMLIGIALSQVQNFRVDWLFTSFAFALKFLVWPAATALVFYIDKSSGLHFLSLPVKQSMWLVSVLPLAANTVAFASLLKAEPEKCAIAVLLSTLLGMILMSLALQYPAIF